MNYDTISTNELNVNYVKEYIKKYLKYNSL